MASLLIKNVPKTLHAKLKDRAQDHRRSLNSEVLVLLEEAIGDLAGPPTLEAIDRMRVSGDKPLTDALIARAKTEGRS